MYNKMRIGPNIELCGTPYLIILSDVRFYPPNGFFVSTSTF